MNRTLYVLINNGNIVFLYFLNQFYFILLILLILKYTVLRIKNASDIQLNF